MIVLAFGIWAALAMAAAIALAFGLDEEVVPLGWGAPEGRDQSEYTAPVHVGPAASNEGATSAEEGEDPSE